MARPRKEPTEQVRLPTALLAPLKAEAEQRGVTLAQVVRERIASPAPAHATKIPKPSASSRAAPPKRPPAVPASWTCPQHGGFNRQPHCLVTGCTATMKAIK